MPVDGDEVVTGVDTGHTSCFSEKNEGVVVLCS